MRILLTILLFISSNLFATDYYVSPSGNDGNAGTIGSPFRNWQKLSDVLTAGDIAYIRGGTYTPTTANSADVHCEWINLTGTAGNLITIQNYPGEIPIFDLISITPSYADPTAVWIKTSAYVHIKGLVIRGLKQIADGSGLSRGFSFNNSNHCIVENVEVYNIGGSGFKLEYTSSDNQIINCDAHHIGDGLTAGAWENADGFSCTGGDLSSDNILTGCRAWFCSDDGFDFFDTDSLNTFNNCWAFWNGVLPWRTTNTNVTPDSMTVANYATWHNNAAYIGGSGEGFKLGPSVVQNFSLLSRILNNCVSFENRGTGYTSNSNLALTNKHQFYNCIAYNNDNDGFSYGVGYSLGATQVFKNCWAWGNNIISSGGDWVYDGNNSAGIDKNVWMTVYAGVSYGNLYPNTSVSSADFVSVSTTGVDGTRQLNGNLPELNFLKLANGSDLINAGVNVSLPYKGAAPDVNAFEYDTPINLIRKRTVIH